MTSPDPPLLAAAPNFRDFGGHTTSDGRRVQRGRLFRSELLLGLTPRDLHTLAGLDIGLVCDLRSPGERSRMSNEWPEGSAPEILALDINAELSAVQPDKWTRRLADPTFDASRAHAALIDNYRRMPASYAADLRALFERLSRPDAPNTLVHCAAGKDRTGFVSAMILSALGVTREGVLEDYLATGELFTYERLVATRLRTILHGAELPEHAYASLRVLASVDLAFIDAALETVRTRFGGIDTYLQRECGLDAARREALRQNLLEA
jgi:protein-tyrosine phosphatase